MTPQEFTPELNEDFVNRLAGRAEARGAVRQGQARSEALSRGLEGDVFESSAVGGARAETDQEIKDIEGDFAYNVAGLAREERLGKQNRGYEVEDRNFSAGEAEKNRALQERLARLGYDFQQNRDDTSFRRSYQMAPFQIATSALGYGLGRKL